MDSIQAHIPAVITETQDFDCQRRRSHRSSKPLFIFMLSEDCLMHETVI